MSKSDFFLFVFLSSSTELRAKRSRVCVLEGAYYLKIVTSLFFLKNSLNIMEIG